MTVGGPGRPPWDSTLGHLGVPLNIDNTGGVPDGEMRGMWRAGRLAHVFVGVYEPHAVAKRAVREAMADVLAWLDPSRRPPMITGQEIIDQLSPRRPA